jgi:hypothetical protein
VSDIERPQKGDKVMYSDEAWAASSSQLRAFGRRVGVIVKVYPEDDPCWRAGCVAVRWGDSKNAGGFPVPISMLAPADLVNAKDLKPPKKYPQPRGLSAWEKICWSAQGAYL